MTELEALEKIASSVNMIAGLVLATFMFGVATLIYVIANYYKK